jgi:DNA-binding CsgD family transcriptional regulator
MAKSTMLRGDDVRSIIKLVGECRDLGDDWWSWQRRWIDGLMWLTDAELGISGEVGDVHRPQLVMLSVPATFGQPGFDADPQRIQEVIRDFCVVPGQSQFAEDYLVRLAGDDGVALTNRDLYSDREWRRSLDMQTVGQAFGTESTLLCCRRIPAADGNEVLDMTLCREAGRRSFSGRDCAIVREAVAAVAPLLSGSLARFREPSPSGLPPRARRVLACFLEGDGDKQVAARLGIRPHTVNQYAKLIFRHFGVRSRPELLARWLRRGWGANSSWAE